MRAVSPDRVKIVEAEAIRRFFDSVDQERVRRVLAERVADPRILRLVCRGLRAGVLEGTEWHETAQGTSQGAGISPLLANIFLHSVLDRWLPCVAAAGRARANQHCALRGRLDHGLPV